MMTFKLSAILVAMAIILVIIVTTLLVKDRVPIKYSLLWYLFSLVLLIAGLAPGLMEFIAGLFGFKTMSNFIIGFLIGALTLLTVALTVIASDQKKKY